MCQDATSHRITRTARHHTTMCASTLGSDHVRYDYEIPCLDGLGPISIPCERRLGFGIARKAESPAPLMAALASQWLKPSDALLHW